MENRCISLNKNDTSYKHFVTYLKVLACLLITNSHCSDIYPVSFLAVGSSWGNSLFFILSGYCLAKIKNNFGEWYLRRIKRIIKPLIVIIFISVVWTDGLSFIYQNNIESLTTYYINKYWFAFAILLLYVFYYFIVKTKDSNKIRNVIIFLIILYAIIYALCVDKSYYSIEPHGFDLFKSLSYFIVFIIGGYIGKIASKIQAVIEKTSGIIWCLFVGCATMIWIFSYVIIAILNIGVELQFIVHISIWLWAISMLFWAEKYENNLQKLLPSNNKVLEILADSTFEIYLIQMTFKKCVEYLKFPGSWIAFWAIALIGGSVFRKVMKIMENRLEKIRRRYVKKSCKK